MDKLSEKERELKKLGEEQVEREKQIRARYSDIPKGFCVIPELLELEHEFKEKYIAICAKYK